MKSASKCKDGLGMEERERERERGREGEREREGVWERYSIEHNISCFSYGSADEDRFFMSVSDEIKTCVLSTMLQEWLKV